MGHNETILHPAGVENEAMTANQGDELLMAFQVLESHGRIISRNFNLSSLLLTVPITG